MGHPGAAFGHAPANDERLFPIWDIGGHEPALCWILSRAEFFFSAEVERLSRLFNGWEMRDGP
ncbi:hypothetical protein RR42_m2338 [Cupriavidus basilensis]|uniref:Uncharacterized protein n=1 Tax=Cupriavidus basilensis TaxID=68895 RepID=A0A0C4Y9V8_9BURK|nr:hypothetical protein RR42_m2338 [Cupriavidus basilensis]